MGSGAYRASRTQPPTLCCVYALGPCALQVELLQVGDIVQELFPVMEGEVQVILTGGGSNSAEHRGGNASGSSKSWGAKSFRAESVNGAMVEDASEDDEEEVRGEGAAAGGAWGQGPGVPGVAGDATGVMKVGHVRVGHIATAARVSSTSPLTPGGACLLPAFRHRGTTTGCTQLATRSRAGSRRRSHWLSKAAARPPAGGARLAYYAPALSPLHAPCPEGKH